MKALQKNQLRTVRFASREAKLVDSYLKQNPLFDGFSALARVATLAFIGEEGAVYLNPIRLEGGKKRPSFLWDYDLSDLEVREILTRPGYPDQKRWLIGRILAEATLNDVFSYLSLDMIRKALPQIRLRPQTKERWEAFLKIWTHDFIRQD